MIRFLDGPAAGKVLELQRTPIMLRVTVNGVGKIDALDQLDDVAQADESIHVYRIVPGSVGTVHIDFCDKQGRRRGEWRRTAEYSLWSSQPGDEHTRDNDCWRSWCETLQRSELEAVKREGGGA